VSTIIRPLSVLLACLACGQATGQDVASRDGVPLRGMVIRTIAEESTPLDLRLRLYVDRHPGVDFDGQDAPLVRAPRIGVEFTLAPSSALSLARGTLLRADLDGNTQLSLRVRRRGLGVLLHSEF
jgi:hypothetical protein